MKQLPIPVLIVMVGLDGSQRSQIADYYQKEWANTVCVKQTSKFAKYLKQIDTGLSAGYTVIADAPNLTVSSRVELLAIAKKHHSFAIAQIVAEDISRCIERCPEKEERIYEQLTMFQVPSVAEGFDSVNVTSYCKDPDEKFIEKTYEQMRGIYLRNDYHDHGLDEHCANAACLFIPKGYCKGFNLGARLHDIGKLFTETVDENGFTHHHSHENVGAYYLLCHTDDIKASVRFTDEQVLNAVFLVNYHMLPLSWQSGRSLTKWKQRFPEEKIKLIYDFNACDRSRALEKAMEEMKEMERKEGQNFV